MDHVKDVETGSWNVTPEILKDVVRDFASTEMIWQKNLRRTSTIGRSHWRHEPEEFGDFEELLTFRRPNPCYILMLDAMFVSCHLFDVFLTAPNKNLCFQNCCLYCVYPSLSFLSHPKPMDPIDDEWRWAYIF